MRLALFSALLLSCTNVDGKFSDINSTSGINEGPVFDLCQDRSAEVSKLLDSVNVGFRRKATTLDQNFDAFAYYSPNDLIIYYDFVEQEYRGGICVHELWHAVLHQKKWSLQSKEKHLLVIYDYIRNYNSKTNDINRLLKDTEILFVDLLNLKGVDEDTANKIKMTYARLKELRNMFNSELSNPLHFNIDKEFKYSLKAFFTSSQYALQDLIRVLDDAGINIDLTQLVRLESYYKTFQSRYFVDVSFDEIIPQLLTVLYVTTEIPFGHINQLNEYSLALLSDLKIEGLDLAPYIQRYRAAHNL